MDEETLLRAYGVRPWPVERVEIEDDYHGREGIGFAGPVERRDDAGADRGANPTPVPRNLGLEGRRPMSPPVARVSRISGR